MISLWERARIAEIEAIAHEVPWHCHALCALAMTRLIEAQLMHSLIVKCQSLLALVEAIVGRVGWDVAAVLAVTSAQLLYMGLVWPSRLIVFYLNHGIQRFFQRLPVLPPASLQVNGVSGGTECCSHELGTGPAEAHALRVPVVDHCKVIYPHDGPKALDPCCPLVWHEVSDEQALPLGLHELIVALGRACSRATGGAERARPNARDLVAAGASERGQVDRGSIPFVKLNILIAPGSLHNIENVETPINRMIVISMLVCADVAHSYIATSAVLDTPDVRVDILVVQEASLDFACCFLGGFDWQACLGHLLPSLVKEIS